MLFFTSLLGRMASPFIGTPIGRLSIVRQVWHWLWGILGPKGSQILDVQGFKMYTDPKDSAIAPQLLSKGSWEPFETEIFKGLVKPGMTVVDIGANIGYYSLLASRLVGESGKVYAFEPFENTFEILKRNIAVNGLHNILPTRKAILDKVGIMRLYFSRYTPACNSVTGKGKFVFVPCTTLDQELKGYKVDLIKMDIEGAEALAFDGMQTIIQNNPNLILLTEIFSEALTMAGSSFETYVAGLLKWFTIQVIEERKHRITACETAEQVQGLMSGQVFLNLLCTRRQ